VIKERQEHMKYVLHTANEHTADTCINDYPIFSWNK